ncbi:type IV-A pilus assembly ATPase PilB, partial [Undibacterium sp.]|uniref:type IV-A pilus assembly ATPase PilB n=1 Tax=Undibacterium sp. TaxID=1914977 RepID=UPI002B78FCA5
MAAVSPTLTLQSGSSGLARALAQANVLAMPQIDGISKKAQTDKLPFIDALLQSGLINARDLAAFCSEAFGYPLVDLAVVDESLLPEKIVDGRLMQTQRIVALAKRGNKISVAVSDPTNAAAIDQIKFQTGMGIELVVVQHDVLIKTLERLSKTSEQSLNELSGDDMEIDFNEEEVVPSAAADAAALEIDDAPVVKFLQKMLLDAINMGASDLHFEPFEKFYRIRFRVDGELREIAQPPLAIKEKLASRIKVISKLDISEKRIPQDGRMKLVMSASRSIDFRVSTLPTLFGEKIVMRILDGSQAQMGIDALGYDPDQKEILMNAITRPYGMVLVTGPTGSGKTVSLYTCLNVINKPGINISTAEDPAEINLPGVNQVNVNDRAGLTFAAALKSFLRQDPDIIMVGEVRDLETAQIATKAALTGHLVLSTLHTNDAPSTITRLADMGIEPFLIATSVRLVIAQRLVRKVCKECKVEDQVSSEELRLLEISEAEAKTIKFYKGAGCTVCAGTG